MTTKERSYRSFCVFMYGMYHAMSQYEGFKEFAMDIAESNMDVAGLNKGRIPNTEAGKRYFQNLKRKELKETEETFKVFHKISLMFMKSMDGNKKVTEAIEEIMDECGVDHIEIAINKIIATLEKKS